MSCTSCGRWPPTSAVTLGCTLKTSSPMMKIDIVSAVLTILNELIDGAASLDTWILNPGDPGVLRSLEKISAADASQVPSGSGASVATHVHHLQYGLHLLNRWSRGEEPFADSD